MDIIYIYIYNKENIKLTSSVDIPWFTIVSAIWSIKFLFEGKIILIGLEVSNGIKLFCSLGFNSLGLISFEFSTKFSYFKTGFAHERLIFCPWKIVLLYWKIASSADFLDWKLINADTLRLEFVDSDWISSFLLFLCTKIRILSILPKDEKCEYKSDCVTVDKRLWMKILEEISL